MISQACSNPSWTVASKQPWKVLIGSLELLDFWLNYTCLANKSVCQSKFVPMKIDPITKLCCPFHQIFVISCKDSHSRLIASHFQWVILTSPWLKSVIGWAHFFEARNWAQFHGYNEWYRKNTVEKTPFTLSITWTPFRQTRRILHQARISFVLLSNCLFTCKIKF